MPDHCQTDPFSGVAVPIRKYPVHRSSGAPVVKFLPEDDSSESSMPLTWSETESRARRLVYKF